MGNFSSSGSSKVDTSGWTQERKDLKSLADQFAFGDDELRHVYRAYHRLDKLPPEERVSFVQDWGLACYDPDSVVVLPPPSESPPGEGGGNEHVEGEEEGTARPPPRQQPPTREEQMDDRKRRLQRVDAILGDFGNRLYAATFLAAGDRSVYDATTTTSTTSSRPAESSAAAILVDEYTRKSRLEAVFDGLAKCSRRGSQATITALFHVLEQPSKQRNDANDEAPVSASAEDATVVDALELVTIGYHLALATAILSGAWL